MIAITFRDFFLEKYDEPDDGFSIYVLRDGKTVLYVGMTNVSVYTRWFGYGGHMRVVPSKKGTSFPISGGGTVGDKIEINYPESADWTIELWTTNECIEFLSKLEDVSFLRSVKARETEYTEGMMIKHLKPLYNSMLSSGGSDLPRTEKERMEEEKMKKAYREIFDK